MIQFSIQFHYQKLTIEPSTADDGREAQVLPQPRRVYLRLPLALPGHHQPLHVHPHDHWGGQIGLERARAHMGFETTTAMQLGTFIFTIQC